MNQTILRLFELIQRQTGLVDLPVNLGIEDWRIDELWNSTGLLLPDDYRALLRVFNGQAAGAGLTFPPGRLTFLSLEDAMEMWRSLGVFQSEDEPFDELVDDGRVRGIVYHQKRFPIADYEVAAETLFLDFIPGDSGCEGQLVFNPAESTFYAIAPSVQRLMSDYVSILETGKARVVQRSPNDGGVFVWVTSDGQFLDFERYMHLVRR